MKKILVLTLVVLFLGGGLAIARDMSEVGETIWETATGENGSCPLVLTPYIAKTWKDAANLPIVGKADVRVELGYEFDSHDLTKNNQVNLKAGLEF